MKIFKISIGVLLMMLVWMNTSPLLWAQADLENIEIPSFDHPMTLEECVLYAIGHSPTLQGVKLDEAAIQYKIKEVKSTGLPQVNASGQYMNNFSLAEQLLPGEFFGQPGTIIPVKFGVAHNLAGNIELNQILFSKSYFTGLKAAQTSQSLAKLNTFKTTEDLVYNVAQIYLQLQLTKKQTEILNANLDRISQLIEIAQVQFEEGLIKRIDVDQLKVNKTNLLSELQNINIGVAQQMNLLKYYMGMPLDAEIHIADQIVEDNKYPLAEKLILTENTTLKLLDKQFELSTLELENIKAGYYPSLSGFVRYGWQGQTDKIFSNEDKYDIRGTRTGVFGLSLNVPIFDGFRKKNQVQQIQLKQSQLILERQNLTNLTKMEFANANEKLYQNRLLLQTQKENMQLAESLYGVTKLSYQEGIAPLTELLNAETSLKEAQTQYLAALLQLNLAELDHLKTSGQLAMLIKENIQ